MAENESSDITIRAAAIGDVPAIEELIAPFVQQRHLLPRTAENLQRLVPNGFVAEMESRIVGFAAIEVYSTKMAELLCLAVSELCQGKGVGRQLVEQCVQRAREHEVDELMAITSSDEFFQSCGFDYTLPREKRALFIQTRQP